MEFYLQHSEEYKIYINKYKFFNDFFLDTIISIASKDIKSFLFDNQNPKYSK